MDSRVYFSAVSIHDHARRVAGALLIIERQSIADAQPCN
jgi:hypothetical protein